MPKAKDKDPDKSRVAKWAYWRGVRRGREEAEEVIENLAAIARRAAGLLDEADHDAKWYGLDYSYYSGYSGNKTRRLVDEALDAWGDLPEGTDAQG